MNDQQHTRVDGFDADVEEEVWKLLRLILLVLISPGLALLFGIAIISIVGLVL